jgi:hypothetical protein
VTLSYRSEGRDVAWDIWFGERNWAKSLIMASEVADVKVTFLSPLHP